MSDIPNLRHGMSEPHETERFWLMPGDVPTGPFTVPEVHDQLTRGTITWQTKACRMDEGVWRPLIQTPGIGQAQPTHVETPIPKPSVHNIAPSPAIPAQPAQEGLQKLIGVGVLCLLIAVAGLAVYGIYEWGRPLRPMEVCQRLDQAKNIVEARKYVTYRMYPFLEAAYADPTNPNDTFEFTSEVDGNVPDTKHVGFRGSWLNPEVGERVKMEGYVKLIRQDGWKVDDMFVSYVEGSVIPKPFSLIDEIQKSKDPPKPTVGTTPTTISPFINNRPKHIVPKTAPQPTKIEKFFMDLHDRIGWGGIGLIVAGIVAYGIYDNAKTKQRQRTPQT